MKFKDFYRVAACAPVVGVGDVAANLKGVLAALSAAREAGAAVLLLPELALSGSTCGDLYAEPSLLRAVESALDTLREATRGWPGLVVAGAPVARAGRILDAACAFSDGRFLGLAAKESPAASRVFAPASAADVPAALAFELPDGLRIRVDLFDAPETAAPAPSGAAEIVLVPPSGAESLGAADRRRLLARARSAAHRGVCLLATPDVSESVTDGVCPGHLLVAVDGEIAAESRALDGAAPGTLLLADIDAGALAARATAFPAASSPGASSPVGATPVAPTIALPHSPDLAHLRLSRTPYLPDDAAHPDWEGEVLRLQAAALRRRMAHTGAKALVVGVSGGLDSALALLVCAEACRAAGLPPSAVHALSMPGFGTGERTRGNARDLCAALGVQFREADIRPLCLEEFKLLGHDPAKADVVFENVQARARTQLLMNLANQVGGMVVGTGDLSEAALGWCTFNGDHMAHYNVNGSVPKTMVRRVVAWRAARAGGAVGAALRDIVDTPVSPELLPAAADGGMAQQTEAILGRYDLHDFFLFHLLRNHAGRAKLRLLARAAWSPEEVPDEELDRALATFLRRFATQQFKRNCSPEGPLVCAPGLSPRAGLRMPSDLSPNLWGRDD